MKVFFLGLLILSSNAVCAQNLITCHAKESTDYWFQHPVFNPTQSHWKNFDLNGISYSLAIIGDEFDIIISGDGITHSARENGRIVSVLASNSDSRVIGVFSDISNSIFTFDFQNREMVVSSHQIGPGPSYASIAHADCK